MLKSVFLCKFFFFYYYYQNVGLLMYLPICSKKNAFSVILPASLLFGFLSELFMNLSSQLFICLLVSFRTICWLDLFSFLLPFFCIYVLSETFPRIHLSALPVFHFNYFFSAAHAPSTLCCLCDISNMGNGEYDILAPKDYVFLS